METERKDICLYFLCVRTAIEGTYPLEEIGLLEICAEPTPAAERAVDVDLLYGRPVPRRPKAGRRLRRYVARLPAIEPPFVSRGEQRKIIRDDPL
ncbi:hypothetical protein EVAR_80513_1 [Eumeta japonica]|uniref:Uncharacterized protein n=1 Tax=Eumeta variegata TaxID=151549 RepID=A0A4C1TLF4_EUMVA|nr:hypothetical protein EVAR_80513_1 [Eumeta japonica]